MLITDKAQYTCHKTLIWLRVSLTCCTYVLGKGGAMIFSFDKSTSLEGGSEKITLRSLGGGGGGVQTNERKKIRKSS